MSAIILFRYNREFPVCRQTVEILRRFNPGVPIHGMYGGDSLDDVPPDLDDALVTNWRIPSDDAYRKWKDGDLCVRDWYNQHGHAIPFDHLYLIEWDMFFLKPLAAIYGALVPGANYGTFAAKHTYAEVQDWYFIVSRPWEVQSAVDYLAKAGMTVRLEELSFGKMGGIVMCREFLERFCREPIPSYSNDEVRLSIYSKAYGIPLIDNTILSDERNLFYVCDEKDLDEEDIAMVHARGGTVLHPVRILVDEEWIPVTQARMGRPTGLEPATTRTTTKCSTN